MAAKRHHASKRARHDEHMGMERYERGPVRHDRDGGRFAERHESEVPQGDYSGEYARRTQEMQDAGMIREDLSAIANLPQAVMIKPYPRTGPYLPEGLDDTIEGVDGQMDYDDSQRRRNFYPKKV